MSIPYLEAIGIMFKCITENSSMMIKSSEYDMVSLQETLNYIYDKMLQFRNNTNRIPQFILMPKSLYSNLPFECEVLKSAFIDNDTVVVSGPEMIEKIMDLNKKGEL